MMRACRWTPGLVSCASFVLALVAPPAPVATSADPPKEKAYGTSDEIEKMLAGWQPPKGDLPLPREELRSPGTDIQGVWEINRGLEYSKLTITRAGPRDFTVELYHT